MYCNLGVIKRPKKPIVWKGKDALFPCCLPPTPLPPTPRPKSNDGFTIARRSDLIGQFLGSTAIKTQAVVDNSLGGVLFIDEVYSLSHHTKDDMFAKECIDTLNVNLSEKKTQLLCIIAGYEKEINDCFFANNAGLRRRFPFVYTIDKYTANDLHEIFLRKIAYKWIFEKGEESKIALLKLFADNMKSFPNFGGDVESLIFLTKIEHSKRVFSMNPKNKWCISVDDVRAGLMQMSTGGVKCDDESRDSVQHMYI
jgi:hypothetical protein